MDSEASESRKVRDAKVSHAEVDLIFASCHLVSKVLPMGAEASFDDKPDCSIECTCVTKIVEESKST